MSIIKNLHKILLLLAALIPLSSVAQTLEITKSFKMNEFSTVLTTYKNEFGNKIKPGVKDNAFPYAVIEVHLKGDARAVTTAKEKLSLDMGALYMVESVTKAYDNKIVFLVSSSVRTIYMTCGDGCEKQAIFEGMQLKPDRIYSGEVLYIPERSNTDPIPIKKQIFRFEVEPKNASVEIIVGEKTEYCKIDDDIQSITLNHGTYQYKVSATRYQTEIGTIQVSDSTRTKSVQLLPDYGWLTLSATDSNSGASAYVINTKTKERIALGNIPLTSYELDRGEYTLQIFQNKYKDYTKKITILPNQTITESPILEPNFISLTLSTDADSEILVNGESYGKGQWSGTLELGEYSIETRKANHRSSYIPLTLTAADAAQTIKLASPTPICGSLTVSGSPTKAAIYIDDKYVGESPMIVNDLLIGEHKVRVEKDNYIMQNEKVFVTPNAELRFDYILENKPLIPFPNTRTKVGDLYYQAVGDGHSVQVVSKSSHLPFNESFSIPVVEIPAQITYNGSIYSVTSIGNIAFIGCDTLTTVTIPQTVKSIGNGAFRGCKKLASINIPNSVMTIGDEAFFGCDSLKSIWIPNSVTNIGIGVFANCSQLTSLVVDKSNSRYDSRNDCQAIIETKTNKLIAGCQNTTFPNSVTSIGNEAFLGCKNLKSIKIPNSVTSIGDEAFRGCEKLASVNIPNSVTSIGDAAFWGCEKLASINIPNSVKSIGEYAFWSCNNLKSIKIPNSVTSIGRSALCSCDKLKLVKTPSDVSCTETPVFCDCKNLQHIIISSGNLKEELFILCDSIKSVKLLDGVTGIGDEAFRFFKNLTSISMPNSVTHIGDEAFSYCKKLTSLSIPKSVKSIGNAAFRGCDNLKSIKISNGVKSIGNGAFWACDNLKSIKIPKSVKSIGNEAFWYCNNLKSIKIPKSVTSIGKDAFDACYNLQTIYIPRGTKAKFAAMEGLKDHVNKLVER